MNVIRVIDFETSGKEPPAEVVEAGLCDVELIDGTWTVGRRHFSALHGAGALPCESRAVHHISPAEIAGLPPFDPADHLEHARTRGVGAFAAHNAAFESQWMGAMLAALPIICTYKAALRIWPDAPAHKNNVLRYWLEEKGICTVDPVLAQPAHRAGPDAYVTAHLLVNLLAHASVEDMIAWTTEPAALPRCPIGKWRGSPWSEVEAGFLDWMLRQATMEHDLKWNADRELKRRRDQLRPR